MSWLAAIPLALVTTLAWLWYVHRKDTREPEPVLLVLLSFVLGCGAALAILWLRPWLDQIADRWPPRLLPVADAFLLTALPEELAKLLAFVPLWLHRETDEPMDGVVYGAGTALGFAAVENALYLQLTGAVDVCLQRGFTATLAHVGFTGGMGFCLATAKFVRGRSRLAWLVGGPLLAVGLHGTYDLLLADTRVFPALVVVLPVTLAILSAKVRWARGPRAPRRDPAPHAHLCRKA